MEIVFVKIKYLRKSFEFQVENEWMDEWKHSLCHARNIWMHFTFNSFWFLLSSGLLVYSYLYFLHLYVVTKLFQRFILFVLTEILQWFSFVHHLLFCSSFLWNKLKVFVLITDIKRNWIINHGFNDGIRNKLICSVNFKSISLIENYPNKIPISDYFHYVIA